MSRNRAITIDLDDTLWDCHPVIREAESKLWEWLETNYPKISDNYTQEKASDLRKNVVKNYPYKSHDYNFLWRSVLKTFFFSLECPKQNRSLNAIGASPYVLVG